MYPDYHVAVWQAYQKMKADGSLSPNLMNPTRAKLKDECLLMFNRRYTPKSDDFSLQGYFPKERDEDGFRKAIGKDSDKFKRLEAILNSPTLSKTGDNNIEVLAFLIDFQPRPGHRWDKEKAGVVAPSGETSIIENKDGEKETKDDDLPFSLRKENRLRYWKQRFAYAAVLLILLTTAILYFSRPTVVSGRPRGKCMYWAGEQYLPGPCNVLHHDTPVVQLDSFKLLNFKKITDWRKLSRNDIGKVYYAKIHQQPEIYNRDGFHPIDTNRGLRPLTDYMFNKYVEPLLAGQPK